MARAMRVNTEVKNYAATNHVKIQLKLSNKFDARLLQIVSRNKTLLKVKNEDGSEEYKYVDGLDPTVLEIVRKRLVDVGRTDARAAKAGAALTPFEHVLSGGERPKNAAMVANGKNGMKNLAQYRDKPPEQQQHVVTVKIEQNAAPAAPPVVQPKVEPAHPEFARLIGGGNGTPNGTH